MPDNDYPEGQILGDAQRGLDPKESFKESVDIIDQFESIMADDGDVDDITAPSRKIAGSGVRKQSGTKMERYIRADKAEDEIPPLLKTGQVVFHGSKGKGLVVESSRMEDGKNKIAVKYEAGSEFEYQGTDQEVLETFKVAQEKGDVMTRKENPSEELTITEKTPEGKVKVKNPRGEETIVDPTYLDKKQGVIDTQGLALNVGDTVVFKHKGELKEAIVKVIDKFGSVTIKSELGLNVISSPEKCLVKVSEEPAPEKEETETEKPGISVEKSKETEIEPEEKPEEEIDDGDESQTKIELPKIWNEVLKQTLLEPDVAMRVVQRLIQQVEVSPELMAQVTGSLDKIIPANFTDKEWLKKNGMKMYSSIIKLLKVAELKVKK